MFVTLKNDLKQCYFKRVNCVLQMAIDGTNNKYDHVNKVKGLN